MILDLSVFTPYNCHTLTDKPDESEGRMFANFAKEEWIGLFQDIVSGVVAMAFAAGVTLFLAGAV